MTISPTAAHSLCLEVLIHRKANLPKKGLAGICGVLPVAVIAEVLIVARLRI